MASGHLEPGYSPVLLCFTQVIIERGPEAAAIAVINPDQQHALDMTGVPQWSEVNGFQSHAFNQFGNRRFSLGASNSVSQLSV